VVDAGKEIRVVANRGWQMQRARCSIMQQARTKCLHLAAFAAVGIEDVRYALT
jgi:hypothetical protein